MLPTHTILSTIASKLFDAQERRFARCIDDIHRSNNRAMKETLDGFMYQGKFYKPSDMQGFNGAGKRLTLHLSLWPEIDQALKDINTVDTDKHQILQLLFNLMDGAFLDQHIRDAVPDCISDCLPKPYNTLERCGSPNWKHERFLKQYNNLLPKIEFYSATRLIY